MEEQNLLFRLSHYCYKRGWTAAKPEFLDRFRIGSLKWMTTAEALMDQNHAEGRRMILERILNPAFYSQSPYRKGFLRLLAAFISNGKREEKAKAIHFVEQNSFAFKKEDEILIGPLVLAKRGSDIYLSAIADVTLSHIVGEETGSLKSGYLP